VDVRPEQQLETALIFFRHDALRESSR
jgi:hypothetical protein